MSENNTVCLWTLFVAATVLCCAAITDLKHFKIRNETVLLLAGLFVVYALASGRLMLLPINLAFASLMLLGLLYAYAREQLGGGDLKLLAVAFLWAGPWLTAPFLILLLAFTGLVYSAAIRGWIASQVSEAGLRMPLAPAIAAALIVIFAVDWSRLLWREDPKQWCVRSGSKGHRKVCGPARGLARPGAQAAPEPFATMRCTADDRHCA
jgi:prepilin peptidase CpaA